MEQKLKNYNNKTILVTGHTGFKGSWLSIWLNKLGARVVGVSDNVPYSPSNFEASNLSKIVEDHRINILDIESLKKVFLQVKPDYVFHLAAQSLVRKSYKFPIDTLLTNSIGTANVLESIRILKNKVTAIMITSDKAYDNIEQVWGYKETDNLGGKDPYSASKGMAELVIKTYTNSFFNKENLSEVRIGIGRAGNVIGGGDWSDDRIIPDCIKSWSQNKIVNIRNSNATRPWQHVLEPLSGYLQLGSHLNESVDLNGEAFNFGPNTNQDFSVADLINEMNKYLKNFKWSDISSINNNMHEAKLLKLNCDKALYELKWQSTLNFSETVKMTSEWYRDYYLGKKEAIIDLCNNQLKEYIELAKERNIDWSIK